MTPNDDRLPESVDEEEEYPRVIRCQGCGRLRVTDRQDRRWLRWCWRNSDYEMARYGRLAHVDERHRAPWWWKPWRREPWWFRYRLKCIGWYDCAGEWLTYPYVGSTPNWYERRCLRRIGVTSWPEAVTASAVRT